MKVKPHWETMGFVQSKRDEFQLSREGFSRGSVVVVGKITFQVLSWSKQKKDVSKQIIRKLEHQFYFKALLLAFSF